MRIDDGPPALLSLVLLLIQISSFVEAFSVSPAPNRHCNSRIRHRENKSFYSSLRATYDKNEDDASPQSVEHYHCTVVGKIILDDYRPPGEERTSELTVGGGGPQAAWGAAVACAILRYTNSNLWKDRDTVDTNTAQSTTPAPPPQPISFWGPVGAWSDREDEELKAMLQPCVQHIHLVAEPSLQTPTIQLWHDESQDIQWRPLHGSWGSQGADALWRNRPSADDLLNNLRELEKHNNRSNHETSSMQHHLHMILEMGATAAGGGDDGALLLDPRISRSFSHMSIEPIAFPSENGTIWNDDTASCIQRLSRILQSQKAQEVASQVPVLLPDQYLYEAVQSTPATIDADLSPHDSGSCFWDSFDVAARYGPQGSLVVPAANSSDNQPNDPYNISFPFQIPVASLQTPDGQAVNPTGAGNAYSAAFAVCRAQGWDLVSAACVASAVGATVCEYNHLPPWTWKTLARIRQGALEIASHDRLGVTLPFSKQEKE